MWEGEGEAVGRNREGVGGGRVVGESLSTATQLSTLDNTVWDCPTSTVI